MFFGGGVGVHWGWWQMLAGALVVDVCVSLPRIHRPLFGEGPGPLCETHENREPFGGLRGRAPAREPRRIPEISRPRLLCGAFGCAGPPVETAQGCRPILTGARCRQPFLLPAHAPPGHRDVESSLCGVRLYGQLLSKRLNHLLLR